MMEKATGFLERFKSYFSRKFILAGTTLGMGYHLVLAEKDIEGWALLAGVVLAFFNGADVTEKIAAMRTGKSSNKVTTKETTSKIEEVSSGNSD